MQADAEENANTLNFGTEFENVSCLSNAEVAVVLEKQKETYEMKDINVTPALTQFEAFNDGEVVKLQQFEMAQLANLMQADSEAEEAIALIPSLGSRFTEEDIENILAIVQKQQQQARIAF